MEAKTPLAVGNGEKDIMSDALVAKDVNGLPYIPGTSIAGVVRHMIGEENAKSFLGYQNINKKSDGEGSKIIFSDAKILNSKSEIVDGLNQEVFGDSLLKHYQELPIRQHTRIGSNGTVVGTGKFDEQICFAGTRFCFEIEMVAEENDSDANFKLALKKIHNKTFRIGGGTRSGFGKIEVSKLYTKTLDLKKPEDLKLYLAKNSNLSLEWNGWVEETIAEEKLNPNEWDTIEFNIHARDFFLFGSGFGDVDGEADMTPVKGAIVVWDNKNGTLKGSQVLIPATSLKGALAHRIAFHWNKLNKIFVGSPLVKYVAGFSDKKRTKPIVNPAVKVLFGYEGEVNGKKVQNRGNLIFHDIIKYDINNTNINKQVHVSIDRFTGGAKANSGALFTEKNVYGGDSMVFHISILKDNNNIVGLANQVYESMPDKLRVQIGNIDRFKQTINDAFNNAISDLKNGMLPLGGGTARGNGIFVECKIRR